MHQIPKDIVYGIRVCVLLTMVVSKQAEASWHTHAQRMRSGDGFISCLRS